MADPAQPTWFAPSTCTCEQRTGLAARSRRTLTPSGPPTRSSRLKESSSSRRAEDVEAFIVDQLARWKPATAANRCRSLRVFYGWLQAEGEIPVSPMASMRPPAVPDQPVPVVRKDAVRRLLETCAGRDFEARRDTALILLLVDVGPRHAELAGMRLTDLDSTSRSRSWRARTAGNVRCRSAAGLLRPLTATSESAPPSPHPPRCSGTSATCGVRPNRSSVS